MARWESVLEEVIRDRHPALVAYACLFVPYDEGAEDLVQEALVRVFARARDVEDPYSAEVYVRKAIRTTFLDLARRRKAWRARTHLLVEDEHVPGPEGAVTAGMDVGRALASLTARERACVVLRHFDDLPLAEVAADLGLSTGAVKRYLSDGTRKMRALLGDDDPPAAAASTPRPGGTGAVPVVPVILERNPL